MLRDGSVHIYSRNLENTTSKYPDVVGRMKQALAPGVRSIVLDCEAQAWDSERKVFLPFQVLTTRKRKDVKEEDVKVQVPDSDKQFYAHSTPIAACLLYLWHWCTLHACAGGSLLL